MKPREKDVLSKRNPRGVVMLDVVCGGACGLLFADRLYNRSLAVGCISCRICSIPLHAVVCIGTMCFRSVYLLSRMYVYNIRMWVEAGLGISER